MALEDGPRELESSDGVRKQMDELQQFVLHSHTDAVGEQAETLGTPFVVPDVFPWLVIWGWQKLLPSSFNRWLLSSQELVEVPGVVQHVARFSFASKEQFDTQLQVYSAAVKAFLTANHIGWVNFRIDTGIRSPIAGQESDQVFKITTSFVLWTWARVTNVIPHLKYLSARGDDTWNYSQGIELQQKLRNINGFSYKYGDYTDVESHGEALAVWWDFEVVRQELVETETQEQLPQLGPREVVLISKGLKMPSGVSYYELGGNSLMTWSVIEIGSGLVPNYVTIQSDPQLFPIKDWETFCQWYQKKYGKRPKLGYAWPRTDTSWLPIGLNRSINAYVESYNNNGWNGGSWFLSIRNGKANFKLLKDVTDQDIEWFQERLAYSPQEWNRFASMSDVQKSQANSNIRRRWIQLSDGTNMIWQSNDPSQKMYQDIDRDSNSVYIVKNGQKMRISYVMSLESVGSGNIFIDGLGGASTNSTLNNAKRWGTNPASNVVVWTD